MSEAKPVPIDDNLSVGECACEFTHDPAEPDEESFNYLRRFPLCKGVWWGLHCPHDGFQNPCPNCGTVPMSIPES